MERFKTHDVLVGDLQECSCYPDDNRLLDGELGVYPTPRKEPYGDPERQTEEEGQGYLVCGIQGSPRLFPVRVKTLEGCPSVGG